MITLFLIEYYSAVHGATERPNKTPEEQRENKSGQPSANTQGNLINLGNRTLNGTPGEFHHISLGTYAAVGFLVALLAGITLMMMVFLVKQFPRCNRCGQQNQVATEREIIPTPRHFSIKTI